MVRGAGPKGAVIALAIVSGLLPAFAEATPRFGRHDVRTIFYIEKSTNRNRVDYGIRLDAQCRPLGAEPVYAYWHRFEPGETEPYGDLNWLDRRAYGISSQRVRSRSDAGSWVELNLVAMPRERVLVLTQRHEGRCIARARMTLRSRPAFVRRVFVRLHNPFSVDRVTFFGEDAETGERIVEHREP